MSRADSKKILVLIIPLIILVLFFQVDPVYAKLEPLYKVVRSDSTGVKDLWQFFLSTVNYIFVAGLLLAIFANVLRFNIDTYGIKKILPSLMVGFLLANFSFFIATALIDLSAVLSNTADSLVCSAMGITSTTPGAEAKCILKAYNNNLWSLFSQPETILAVVGTIAVLIGGGVVLGLVLAATGILMAFFPSLVLGLLALIFTVRHYIVIYLVALSPVAFMAMGTPFTQGIFQRWWKLFSTWLFMKPIAFFVLAAGALVLEAKLSIGSLLFIGTALADEVATRSFSWINYFIALFIMGASIMISFSAGGAIISKLYGAAKMLGSSARFGIGKLGHNLSEGKLLPEKPLLFRDKLGGTFKSINDKIKGGKLGRVGKFMAGAAFLPEQMKEEREKRIAEITATGRAEAASMRGDTTKAIALKQKKISDLGEKLPFQNINDLQNVLNMNNSDAALAFFDKMKGNGLLPIVIDQLRKIATTDEAIRKRMGLQNAAEVDDSAKFQIGLAKLMGSKVTVGAAKDIKDAQGNVIGQSQTAAIEDRFIANKLSEYEFDAFSKGRLHQFGHQNYDSDSQRYEVVLDQGVHQLSQQAQITAFTAGKPQNTEKLFNFKNVTQTRADGTLELQGWIKNLARSGDISPSLLRGLTQFEGEADMKANWDTIRDELRAISGEPNSKLTQDVINALGIRVNNGYEAMRKHLETSGMPNPNIPPIIIP